jgi:hypothetical protein
MKGGPDERWIAGAAWFVGFVLVSYGFSAHNSAATGRGDAAAPWHPLFVLAPLLVGGALVVGGGVLLVRS